MTILLEELFALVCLSPILTTCQSRQRSLTTMNKDGCETEQTCFPAMNGISSKRTAPLRRLLVGVSVTLETMERLCFSIAAIATTDHRVSMASARHTVSCQSGCATTLGIWSRVGVEEWVRWNNSYHLPITNLFKVGGTVSLMK